MIYTVTLNPALDYMVQVPTLQKGIVNRATSELFMPGGKGINVSLMLAQLGEKSVPLGFAAGFTGRELERLLTERGCPPQFVYIEKGNTRINVKIKGEEETEVNGAGPEISPREKESLLAKLDSLQAGDELVLSGSIPKGMPSMVYRDTMERLAGRGINILVDAEGNLLMETLSFHPFLIKPNHHELGDLFGVKIEDRKTAAVYAKKLQAMGAENVLVSMAGQGAVLVTQKGEVLEADAPKGKVINSTGAGDSMVAGFLAGYHKNQNHREAFLLGLCAGSATAFSTDLATKEEVDALYRRENGSPFQ